MNRLKRLLRQDSLINGLANIKLGKDKNKFLQPIFGVKDIFMTEKLNFAHRRFDDMANLKNYRCK